jgi:hypothetical protein
MVVAQTDKERDTVRMAETMDPGGGISRKSATRMKPEETDKSPRDGEEETSPENCIDVLARGLIKQDS